MAVEPRPRKVIRMLESWRFFVIALAVTCFANASLIFVIEAQVLARASALLSIAAGTALLASLRLPVRRFTLAIAGVSLWLQAAEMLSPHGASLAMASRITAGLILVVAGGVALAGWVRSMKFVWPDRWWNIPLV